MMPGRLEAGISYLKQKCWIALMGTPYQPNVTGSILVIEDAGIFNQVAGVIFAQFTRCNANYFPERDGTVEDVINEWASKIQVPYIKNFLYGHISRRCVLPLGREAILNAAQATLTINK